MWQDTINYVSLCSANQLQLWTKPLHASYHIIDFDLAKAEKIYDQSFFSLPCSFVKCPLEEKSNLTSQSVSQSANQQANQSISQSVK